jgi:hypothetical protein
MTMTDSKFNPRNSLVKFSITLTVKGGSLDVSTSGPPQYYYVVYSSHDILTVTAGSLIPVNLVRPKVVPEYDSLFDILHISFCALSILHLLTAHVRIVLPYR